MASTETLSLRGTVKLVVWDLDETFWRGTLSEEGIAYVPAHHDLVIALAERGIVSSICSKNDFESVQRVLQERGLWRYFVMPQIAWQPKGPMLRALIDQMQLRAENVLFIDDRLSNLREAEHFCPGLQVAPAEAIEAIADHRALRGRADPELRRLAHYEVLAAKAKARAALNIDHDAFLRESEICVEVGHDVARHRDRVLELIERTNQLNYTKERIDGPALDALLAAANVDAGFIRAIDRYGDYGICGFYAIRDDRLEHFLFSCRVLNMGIERWLYQRLDRPALDVVGEVATDLSSGGAVDWIRESAIGDDAPASGDDASANILLKGGCDLDQVVHFFRASERIRTEFNYPGDAGHSVRTDHLEILRRHDHGIAERFADALDRLPFLDAAAYRTQAFDADIDVVVYSVLMDYDQGLYRYRDSDWVVPFGDYFIDVTDQRHRNHVESAKPYAEGFLDWFAAEFTFVGKTDGARLANNVRWLRHHLRDDQLLVLVNGAELDLPHPVERGRGTHHAELNRALGEAVDGMPSTVICDVRPLVTSTAAVVDNIRHYQRWVYARLAERLGELINERTGGRSVRTSRLLGALRGSWREWVSALVPR